LDGLSLYIISEAPTSFIYNFPAVDLETGDYILLHLQTLEKNCVNELGTNLTESGGLESCPTARDLWVAGTEKLLYKNAIVYLQDENGNVMDAVILNETPSAEWKTTYAHFGEIVEDLYNCGMWFLADGGKPTPLDAVDTSKIGTNLYKSVNRDEDRENTHSAQDWYVSDLMKYTPGLLSGL